VCGVCMCVCGVCVWCVCVVCVCVCMCVVCVCVYLCVCICVCVVCVCVCVCVWCVCVCICVCSALCRARLTITTTRYVITQTIAVLICFASETWSHVLRRRVFRNALILVEPCDARRRLWIVTLLKYIEPSRGHDTRYKMECPELEHRWNQEIVFSPHLSRLTEPLPYGQYRGFLPEVD
jgi:hypothetical protein